MSYATIAMSIVDKELLDRIQAAALKEAWAGGPEFSESEFGQQLRQSPTLAIGVFQWPISIDNEADYEYAINSDHPNPGGPDVIDDAKLQAGVQAHWPGLAS